MKIGFTQGRIVGMTLNILAKQYKRSSKEEKLTLLSNLIAQPDHYVDDPQLGIIAKEIIAANIIQSQTYQLVDTPPQLPIFGKEHIEEGAIAQMKTAMQLPITQAGALMPDAHQGYGLPIGGVLATKNAVIPYGVGVDIGCRMCMTLYDLPISYLKGHEDKLKKALVRETRFGLNAHFKQPMDDAVLERSEFQEISTIRHLKDKAYAQIGSSGGGNHFVEFGIATISDPNNEFRLPTGQYFALLSHSGSRGFGATIAGYYTKLAREKCRLPKHAQHLAWLDLNSEEGQEYWLAMNLAGDYASACHHQIHKRLAKSLGSKPLTMVENHHNFAWKEQLNGEEVIVHRKGATPAGKGVLGIIPGSMTAPGFIVRGKGSVLSISSAAHGAGRQMSRRKAKLSLTESEVRKHLKQRGVSLIGGGLDEAPMAYKNIHQVMSDQQDLVEVIGEFLPKIVRMADE